MKEQILKEEIMKKLTAIILSLVMMLSLGSCNSGTQNPSSSGSSGTNAPNNTPQNTSPEWPTQTITVLEPYAAGSTSDVAMRVICSYMERELGQPVVVKNVVGADGATCYTELANSPADGYTLGHVQHSGICIGVFLDKMAFSAESFYYFGSTNPFDHCVSVRSDLGIENLDDLMAWAEKQDVIKVGYSGYVNVFNTMNLFKIKGLEDKLVCIAYDDSPAQACVAGDVDVCVWQKAGTRATAESGGLTIIAALAHDRWEDIPDVPTAEEQGYPVYSIGHAYFAAPAGVPDEVRDKIQAAFEKCINDPETQKQMADMGWTNYYLNAEEAEKYIYEQRDVAEQYLKDLGMI